jgi:hypothetical protein
VISFGPTHESVPRPLWDVQTVRDIFCGLVVTRHSVRCGPREVIVQYAPELFVLGETDIFQRLIETSDRPLVHLLVRPVAAVNPHDERLITVSVGVRCWPTECLRPVRGKVLGVLGVVSWLNVWLTTPSSSTRVCHAWANLSSASRPPAAS